MARWFDRLYNRVENISQSLFKGIVVANLLLHTVSFLTYYLYGDWDVEYDDRSPLPSDDPHRTEIERAMLFTVIVTGLLVGIQTFIGIHSVMKKIPHDLFGYILISTLTNITLLVFYIYAGTPSIQGIRFYPPGSNGQRGEIIALSYPELAAYVLIALYVIMVIVTGLIMKPLYDKFLWEQFNTIGIDRGLQKAFKKIQTAKGSFLIFFCLSLVQQFSLIYFEKSEVMLTVFTVAAVVMLLGVRLGYLAVEYS